MSEKEKIDFMGSLQKAEIDLCFLSHFKKNEAIDEIFYFLYTCINHVHENLKKKKYDEGLQLLLFTRAELSEKIKKNKILVPINKNELGVLDFYFIDIDPDYAELA